MVFTEEEYKRLSEALADEGSYNAVAFKYSADYYDPSQPTEEEDANRETGENSHHTQTCLVSQIVSHSRIHMEWSDMCIRTLCVGTV